MRIAFFGSSLVSSYWNGAATYYRGLLKALAALGHDVCFYEPNAFERQQHRDIADPAWARVIVYPAQHEAWQQCLSRAARECDLLVKASGVGVFDRELEAAVADLGGPTLTTVFWDVDAPATLDTIEQNAHHHMRSAIPRYDLVLTYGGGDPVVLAYKALGARDCVPVYNALDPATHYPVAMDPRFACDLSLLANRLPDREQRVEEFFLRPAAMLQQRTFILGGSGWEGKPLPSNVRLTGHVGTQEHNAFFCSGLATMNVNRESMARYGFSPPTRIFEAAGAGACLISDTWTGIELFLEPDAEILVAADADAVVDQLLGLDPGRCRQIAERAHARVMAQHTYAHRARQVHDLLDLGTKREAAA
jgi:spore maturation protein CgeB